MCVPLVPQRRRAHTCVCMCTRVMRELTVHTTCAGCWDAAPPNPPQEGRTVPT